MLVPNRNYSSPEYRYGFQGQEKDDEIKGSGNSINYKFRMHDPRVGRFLSLDRLAPQYPHNSPYAFSENRVIDSRELEGLEKENATVAKEIEAKDTRTYFQTREKGYKVDTYVDCSEYVHEVVLASTGLNVGTFTEDIKKFFETNSQAVFETDFSKTKLGDIMMWVDTKKRDEEGRTVTHVGVVTKITKSLVTITHASSSKNKIASNVRLSRKKKGNLNSTNVFVGVGRVELLPKLTLFNGEEYWAKWNENINRKMNRSIDRLNEKIDEWNETNKKVSNIFDFVNAILKASGSEVKLDKPENLSQIKKLKRFGKSKNKTHIKSPRFF